MLCPPHPFVNPGVDALEFSLKHLLDESTEEVEASQQRDNIASILSATRSAVAQEILSRGTKLGKLLQPGPGEEVDVVKTPNTQLQNAIRFWINVAQDRSVRDKLAEDKMPLKLYDLLRSENPAASKKIIRRDSVIHEAELDLLIELIKLLTAGVPKLERELAGLLMKDLEHMSNIRDMNFVNKVFL